MKAWVATGLVLLVAGAVVAGLLVDPDLWRSEGERGDAPTVRVNPREHAQAAEHPRARPPAEVAIRTADRRRATCR